LDKFKQLQTFAAVAMRGSLSAVAAAENVAPAIIGRRIDALESRLGVKLMIRTTRKITLTNEGSSFLEDSLRILNELDNAEAAVSSGGGNVHGHLRVTAPAGFGRRHIAPLVPAFIALYPDVSVSLDLTDRVVDLVNEGYDCAVRIGDMPDSNLVSVRLAGNRRVVVASPAYLKRFGAPQTPEELAKHNCLGFGAGAQQRGWLFRSGKATRNVRVSGRIDCTDASVLTEWARSGEGLAWRSLWEVGNDLAEGKLVEVLQDFAAPENGIFALYAQRKHSPARLRAWLDHLRACFEDPAQWIAPQ
jgi:DNA-binding transcriptional LysR family regulator